MDDNDIYLAKAFLQGHLKHRWGGDREAGRSKKGRPRVLATDEEQEAQSRTALVRLLLGQEPLHPEIRVILAGLFATDIKTIPAEFALPPDVRGRKIKIVQRGRGRPPNPEMQQTDIAWKVRHLMEDGGLTGNEAISQTAEESGKDFDTVETIYKKYGPSIREFSGPLKRGRKLRKYPP